ncbi:MAG: FUN14 domain-containing protein [Candidatus Nitrosopolaris sp.]
MRGISSELQIEEFVFSAGGGFLFGAVVGFAITKVMKIAAVVVGLFAAALAYLSYKGLIDVKSDFAYLLIFIFTNYKSKRQRNRSVFDFK